MYVFRCLSQKSVACQNALVSHYISKSQVGPMPARALRLNFILCSGRTTGQKMDVSGEEGGGSVQKKCSLMRERPRIHQRRHQTCGL